MREDGSHGSPATARLGSFRTGHFGKAVLKMFHESCNALKNRAIGRDKSIGDVEVECRLGEYNMSSRSFVPGLAKEHFQAMLRYFVDKVDGGNWKQIGAEEDVTMTFTDHVDVLFDDGVRATVKILPGVSSKGADSVEIVDVITKKTLATPQTFFVDGSSLKDPPCLRIGISNEESLPRENTRFENYAETAKKLVSSSMSIRASHKILGGADVSLVSRKGEESAPVFLHNPPDGESAARGKTVFEDPVLASCDSKHRIPLEIAAQLKWTLLHHARLPWISGKSAVELREKEELGEGIFLTNHPGTVTLNNGSRFGVYACQYVLQVKSKESILCGRGKFAAPKEDDFSSSVEIFRHKKRWSFELRPNCRLDLTEIRSGPDPRTLFNEKPTYEAELEKVLVCCPASIRSPNKSQTMNDSDWSTFEKMLSDLYATRNADDLLCETASRFFFFALPPLSLKELPDSTWRDSYIQDIQRHQEVISEYSNDRLTVANAGVDLQNGTSSEVEVEGNDQVKAESFYSKLDRRIESRSESLIYHMRCLNNFVKSVAINEAIHAMRTNIGDAGILETNILDLGCGKGADILKILRSCKDCDNLCVGLYVGADIAQSSLEDAVDRLQGMRGFQMPRSVKFIAADLGKDNLFGVNESSSLTQWESQFKRWISSSSSGALSENVRFQFVNMQFSLHYMFQSYDRAVHFFRMISCHMEVGGVFVATTVNADEVVSRLLQTSPDSDVYSFKDKEGVELCRIELNRNSREQLFGIKNQTEDNQDSSKNMFGIRYNFVLLDGLDDDQAAVSAPEWLAPLPLLQKLAVMNGLKIVRYDRLTDYALRHMQTESGYSLCHRMNVLNQEGSISECEWDISSLYVVIEFHKEKRPANYSEALQRFRNRVAGFSELPNKERTEMLNYLMEIP